MIRQNVTVKITGIQFIVIICLACLALVAAIFAFIIRPLKSNPGMVQGMKIIKNDPEVAKVFGSPIRQSIIVMGQLHYSLNGEGWGTLWTPISGPKNTGTANLVVTKPTGGKWELDSMSIDVNRKVVLVYWDVHKSDSGFQYIGSTPSSSNTPVQFPAATPIQPPTEVPTP